MKKQERAGLTRPARGRCGGSGGKQLKLQNTKPRKTQNRERQIRLRQMSGPEHTQEKLLHVPESVFRCVCLPALPPSVSQQLYHAQALISASALIHTRMKDPGNVLVFLSEQFAVSHSHLGASWCCENASSRHFHTFK